MSGTNSVNKSNCSSIETISDVPVTLVPELSQEFATPASIGSVTAVNTIGISFVALYDACKLDVAIANIISTLDVTNWSEIVFAIAISPCAFW